MWKTLKNFEVNTTTLLKKLAISIYMCCVCLLFLIILLCLERNPENIFIYHPIMFGKTCLESSAMEFFKVSMTLSYLVVSQVMEVPPKIVHFI
jgi:hypothetical protein